MNQPRQKKHKKLVTAILLAGLLMIEGWMYFNHYSYSHHLEEASKSLLKLEALLESDLPKSSLSASVLDSDSKEDQELEDDELSHLAGKAVKSTEHALRNIDDLKDVQELKSAIDEILDFQNYQISVLTNASETLNDPNAVHEMTDAIDCAFELQEKTLQAKEKIESAIENNQETVHVVIIAEKKHHGQTGDQLEEVPDEADSAQEEAAEEVVDEDKEAEVTTVYATHPTTQSSPADANAAYALEQQKKDAAQREANRQRILLIQSAQGQ